MENAPNLSIYGQENGNVEDFPVLKAFQQYIDAEQSKARRRFVALSCVFAVLLAAVVAFFIMQLQSVNNRNQQLGDRLLEYVINDRNRANAAATQSAAAEDQSTAKMMAGAITALQEMQKQLLEQKTQSATTTTAVESKPNVADLESQRRANEELRKLERARAALQAEREKLAAQQELNRQEMLERQRRKLYPEYYARKDLEEAEAAAAALVPIPVAPQPKPVVTTPAKPVATAPVVAPKSTPAVTTEDDDDSILDDDSAIEYFQEEDTEIPVQINGKTTEWDLPTKK